MNDVTKLPVKFKEPAKANAPTLKVVGTIGVADSCNHRWFFVGHNLRNVTYLVREGETEVECSNCRTKLDPMWVLRLLAGEESQWSNTREAYIDEMKRLEQRKRTTCDHCGKMTRISRN